MEDTKFFGTVNRVIEHHKARSAWDRGVKVYALELADELRENAQGGYINIDSLRDYKTAENHLLSGASDWSQYSWGGCSLIYDSDIAERLCCPSELKKTRNGERRPNSREEWLDTQARALRQAARLTRRAIFAAFAIVDAENNERW